MTAQNLKKHPGSKARAWRLEFEAGSNNKLPVFTELRIPVMPNDQGIVYGELVGNGRPVEARTIILKGEPVRVSGCPFQFSQFARAEDGYTAQWHDGHGGGEMRLIPVGP